MKKIFAVFAVMACAFSAKAYDVVAAVSIEGDTKWYFDIELENNDIDFTAFQLDITLDSKDVVLKSSDMERDALLADHSLQLSPLDGRYRIVCYSTSNSLLRSKTGRLFCLTLDGDIQGITINKIIFAKPDGTEVEADVFTRTFDRYGDPDALRSVSEAQDVNKVIYNTDGKQRYRIDRRGIYIQNGKKIAVK